MKRPGRLLLLLIWGVLASAGCNRQHGDKRFLPASPQFSDSLVLSVSASSMPADGFSRMQITAQISGGADPDKRQVRFTTDNGDFPRSQAQNGDKRQTTTAEVNSNGQVTVDLRSSTSPTLATITAEVLEKDTGAAIAGLITRVTVEFTPADASSILQLSASSETGEADSESVLFIHADVAPELPLDNKVTFVTTLGTFISGTVTLGGKQTVVEADIGRRATAALKSPETAGVALITATVMQTTQEIRIVYDPALPEVIVVNLEKTKLERGGTTDSKITLLLSRSQGEVSDGLAVEYSAFEKAYGQPLDLLFSMQELTEDEMAEAKVSLGAVEFIGIATIRAEIGGVRGEADIEIVGSDEVPDIDVDPSSLHFGKVSTGSSSDRKIDLRNVGEEDLAVGALATSGGEFSVVSPPPLPSVIAPGDSLKVTVRFSPTAVGEQAGTLTITSNDPDEGSLAVSLAGEGI